MIHKKRLEIKPPFFYSGQSQIQSTPPDASFSPAALTTNTIV